MQFLKMASATLKSVNDGVKRFAMLEQVLAAVCILIPLLLIVFDHGRVRDSISAYYNMERSQVFYFPLTVAAMLFIVNGVVKDSRPFNTVLGVMLAGVILFNHVDASWVHGAFAVAFFGGNAVVILGFNSTLTWKKEARYKALLILGIAGSMLGCFVFGWFTLFWAEWVSFAIIALHYIIDSSDRIDKDPAARQA